MNANATAKALLNDPHYAKLKDYVIEKTGLFYFKNKDADFSDRLFRRCSVLDWKDCSSYLTSLKDPERGAEELDQLIIELTIGESYFFRNREQFEALQNFVLPDLIKKKASQKQLRIWSAACSTGEEPYSLSILLKDVFSMELQDWSVEILATDINRQFLDRAQKGVYGEWSFRLCSDEFKEKHFGRTGQSLAIKPAYKKGVTFQYHNLVADGFPSLIQSTGFFDLIFCRNVMIYFDEATNRRIVSHFHESLLDGGWLMTGHAELFLQTNSAFKMIQKEGITLYKKDPQKTPNVSRHPEYLRHPGLDPGSSVFEKPLDPGSPLRSVRDDEKKRDDKKIHVESEPDLAAVRQLADQAQWESAAALCEAFIRKDKLNPIAHFYHALILEQMGSLSNAHQAFRRALYLDRGFLLAHYHFGLFLQKKGDQKNAFRSFQNLANLLDKQSDQDDIPDSDGMKIMDLMKLTRMQLDGLEAA